MNEITYVPPTVPNFRLDLHPNADFTRKGWGKKLKALGGDFDECRGAAYVRFCTVPNTDEGRAWAMGAVAAIGVRKETRAGTGVIVLHPRSDDTHKPWQSPQVVHALNPADVGSSIEAAVSAFLRWHAAWWEREGRAAAEAEQERERKRREWMRQQAPTWVADKVREALKLGVEPDVIREAVNSALMDHATALSIRSQEARS